MDEQTAPALPLHRRVALAFTAPGALGDELAKHPRWLGALLMAVVLGTAVNAMLYVSPKGKEMLLTEMRKSARQAGTPPEQMEQMEKMYPLIAGFGIGGTVIGVAIWLLVVAAIQWVIFSAVMGCDLRFKHHWAIATHCTLITSVGMAVSYGLMLARGQMRSTLSPAAFFPHLPETSAVYLLLALCDFFILWWLAATGVAIARAGRIGAGSAVATLYLIYFLIGGAFVAIRAFFFS